MHQYLFNMNKRLTGLDFSPELYPFPRKSTILSTIREKKQ